MPLNNYRLDTRGMTVSLVLQYDCKSSNETIFILFYRIYFKVNGKKIIRIKLRMSKANDSIMQSILNVLL